MIVNVSPETERKLNELAARNGKAAPDLAGSLLEEKLRETPPFVPSESDEEPDALTKAIAKLTSRTPEEAEAARARLFAQSRPPQPLPAGKTLADVISGQWPGDETDEEIEQALEKLS